MKTNFLNIVIPLHLAIALHLFASCGSGNLFSCESPTSGVPCEEKSPEEEAKDKINAGDPDAAIAILLAEIETRGADYDFELHPLLAAAYAKQAGMDIFSITQNITSGEETDNALESFLPSVTETPAEEYSAKLASIKAASDTLSAIPTEYLADGAAFKYQSAAKFQLSLYSISFTLMYMNQFAIPDPDNPGSLDPEKLRSLSAEDAVIILNSLATAAAASGEESPATEAISGYQNEIEASPGDTDEEKLQNYINSKNAGLI